MSFVSLVFAAGVGRTSIGAITLDALIDESTELSGQATQYAVEEGAPISDHVRSESERLSITGWVTAADTTLFGAGGRSKLITAKDALRALHRERTAITVVTGLDTYPDMVMESCKISRDGKGDFYQVACDFRQIRKATLRTAEIPPDLVSPQAGRAKGKAGATKTKAGKVNGVQPSGTERSLASRYLQRGK